MTKHLYLIAGEPSGDLLGARLIKSIKRRDPDVHFTGIGGPAMQEQGLTSLFPMSDLAVMGLAEIIPHIPKLLSRINQTVEDIRIQKPDALITIDAPGFCFRVARKVKGQGFPLIHYVAPTVWAWKPKRAKKIAQFLDHLLVLLPFEPPYFEKEGLATTFVGHSVLESPILSANGTAFRQDHGIPAGCPLLCLLPGSRKGEISQLLPLFKIISKHLKDTFPDVRFVLPTVSHLKQRISEEVLTWGVPVLVVEGEDHKFAAFKAADAALAASGTVSLELALAKTPMVITYRLKPLTYKIVRNMIKVDYASIVNLLHERMVVPEFIQEDSTPEKIIPVLENLLSKGEDLSTQNLDLQAAMNMLGQDHCLKPSERAAETVLKLIKDKNND